mmetsp:Transcript_45329/g.72899  ORF Transcript_45329/g.72899 Transcript_45329/m.72899 type:complete len:138 (+) Transcript_45329:848-1261(+)
MNKSVMLELHWHPGLQIRTDLREKRKKDEQLHKRFFEFKKKCKLGTVYIVQKLLITLSILTHAAIIAFAVIVFSLEGCHDAYKYLSGIDICVSIVLGFAGIITIFGRETLHVVFERVYDPPSRSGSMSILEPGIRRP